MFTGGKPKSPPSVTPAQTEASEGTPKWGPTGFQRRSFLGAAAGGLSEGVFLAFFASKLLAWRFGLAVWIGGLDLFWVFAPFWDYVLLCSALFGIGGMLQNRTRPPHTQNKKQKKLGQLVPTQSLSCRDGETMDASRCLVVFSFQTNPNKGTLKTTKPLPRALVWHVLAFGCQGTLVSFFSWLKPCLTAAEQKHKQTGAASTRKNSPKRRKKAFLPRKGPLTPFCPNSGNVMLTSGKDLSL